MNEEREELSGEYVAELRGAIEAAAAGEADWESFHVRLNAAVASTLAELREGLSTGAAWWDHAARAGMAAVPLGLAAALLLFVLSRNTGSYPSTRAGITVAASSTDSAREAFESALTGQSARRTVIAALLPAPAAAFLGDSSGGRAR